LVNILTRERADSASELNALRSKLESKVSRMAELESDIEEFRRQVEISSKALDRLKSNHASERERWDSEARVVREAKRTSESELSGTGFTK
jgi:chromosome segregation ATPase